MRKKALSPAHRRAVALEVVAAGMCSRLAACRILRLARSTLSYQGRKPTTAEKQLRREGWRVGKRHIQRLRRQGGLRVLPTRRKGIRRGVSTGLPTRATHRG